MAKTQNKQLLPRLGSVEERGWAKFLPFFIGPPLIKPDQGHLGENTRHYKRNVICYTDRIRQERSMQQHQKIYMSQADLWMWQGLKHIIIINVLYC